MVGYLTSSSHFLNQRGVSHYRWLKHSILLFDLAAGLHIVF
jgi:hypothetical protein